MTQEQGLPDYVPVHDYPAHDGFGPSIYSQMPIPYNPYGYAAGYRSPMRAQTSLFFPFFGFPFFRPFPFFGPPFFW